MTSTFFKSGLTLSLLFWVSAGFPESTDVGDEGSTMEILIDFSNSSAAHWQIVNDSVMGGISRSFLEMHDDGYAIFRGTVSLENNGGFASVRTRAQYPVDLSDFVGLAVHVLGDGKTYSMRVRTVKNGRLTHYSYELHFPTQKGVWETHKLAYTDFSPVFRGRSVHSQPLNSDAIMEIGLMIQDRQEGPFSLGISSISVYL